MPFMPTLSVYDDRFDPDPFTVYERESIEMIWKGTGSDGRVVTATMDDPPREIPVFGGNGSYEVTTTGSVFPGTAPVGDYYIYLGQIGGTVRGTVNVRKRTKDL